MWLKVGKKNDYTLCCHWHHLARHRILTNFYKTSSISYHDMLIIFSNVFLLQIMFTIISSTKRIEVSFKLEWSLSFWHISGWNQTDPLITQGVSLYFSHKGCFQWNSFDWSTFDNLFIWRPFFPPGLEVLTRQLNKLKVIQWKWYCHYANWKSALNF